MKEYIKELASIWPKYLKNTTENSAERAYEIIYKILPQELNTWNIGRSHLIEASSGGTGNVTAGPWFATFDTRVTNEAQKGYYLVYLFSVDMKKLVLEIGFATKQFKDFYGDSRKSRGIMRDAAVNMQQSVGHVTRNFPDQSFIKKLSKNESDLSTQGNNKYKLQIGYEKASIFNISYNIDKLDESELKKDYLNFVGLYQAMVSSPDTMSVEHLLDSSISIESIIEELGTPEAYNFVPRIPPTPRSSSNIKGPFKSSSIADSTKKTGDLGESMVLTYERDKLIKAGRADLADKIVHEEALNNKPGWDISSFDTSGKPIQIEVKASKSKMINGVIITENELKAAIKHRESYYLYLVADIKGSKNPKIEIINNPAQAIMGKEFNLTPASHCLKFYPET
ncbi:MrcB family domain-containing protein [Pseudoalteromonas carrageenovora]|uniref:MrcB family domain-containing protein n=1 Tax=Pseudoalteromonas carrageenovora TaxID=227 RepID=UPI0026E1402F|nr:DUF3578 domain-containing protein [Pseudoalteromonas carrageenovora]MDO6465002.1 DUF3578 domain-containing protein [Pseudoalteromonas carrageenovora]